MLLKLFIRTRLRGVVPFFCQLLLSTLEMLVDAVRSSKSGHHQCQAQLPVLCLVIITKCFIHDHKRLLQKEKDAFAVVPHKIK